jgi:tRNA(Ile)-lysidine synthetase-like protein
MINKFEQLKSLVEAKIRNFPHSERRVIVACSGGVDSTALFWVFLRLFQEKKIFSLRLFHFNYGLRGEESDRDESFCRALAEGVQVPFEVRNASQLDREKRCGEGIQEWARRLRREALCQIADDSDWIALAHHADDAAETMLMRLMRGTSLAHLKGMEEWSKAWDKQGALRFFRPWLRVTKKEILAAAAEQNMLFREDSTNAQLDYARNVVRHRVLPELLRLWPAGREKLADLATDAAELAQYALNNALAETGFEATKNESRCSRQKLCRLPDAVALSVLAHMAQHARSGPPKQLSRSNLAKILDAARSAGEPPENSEAEWPTRKFTLEMTRGVFLEVKAETVRSFPGTA